LWKRGALRSLRSTRAAHSTVTIRLKKTILVGRKKEVTNALKGGFRGRSSGKRWPGESTGEKGGMGRKRFSMANPRRAGRRGTMGSVETFLPRTQGSHRALGDRARGAMTKHFRGRRQTYMRKSGENIAKGGIVNCGDCKEVITQEPEKAHQVWGREGIGAKKVAGPKRQWRSGEASGIRLGGPN